MKVKINIRYSHVEYQSYITKINTLFDDENLHHPTVFLSGAF